MRFVTATLAGMLWSCGLACAQAGLPLDRPMGEATARAMLARFGYGPTRESVAAAASLTPRRYLEQGIQGGGILPAPVAARIAELAPAGGTLAQWQAWGPGGARRPDDRADEAGRRELQMAERAAARGAIEARLLAMANSPNQAHEALLAFWLNHFSVFAPKSFVKFLASDYAGSLEAALREDSFEALLRASFRHPAMQFYLDNVQSTAPDSMAARNAAERGRTLGLNENLARELLELHTLGVDGGYTQADVQALARIITGATAWVPRMNDANLQRAGARRDGLALFDPRRHDTGEKRLLGHAFPAGRGEEEIDDALRLLATHPATARHISRKLALRFVSDTPSDALVGAMAETFRRTRGRLSAVLMTMVGHPEFAASLAAGAKFKEPLDQLLSAARATCQSQPIANGEVLAGLAAEGGQAPFMRSTPDGYGAREADWMSPAAIARRVRLGMGIAADRVPLAAGVPGVRPATKDDRPRAPAGTPCDPDWQAIAATLPPLSPATQAALEPLGPREKVAVLLASPEALRR